ncbi:AMMECR1-like protein [Helicosporidium sp. ATCC 50920]|nr:AMMECR1-like protein [Helicosporidium sp. ATCC 50920]|eukprot:KDD75765.1 AMMECR1-like protein [Helicosporidium sp. ATCC 50920]
MLRRVGVDGLLSSSRHHPPPTVPPPSPLFVTWKRTSRHGEARLRGCIGILEPRSLHASLRDYVLASSLRDRRFEPVAERELPLLQCTVSLLHSFEPASDWRDWEIGVHGLIITFACPRTQDMLTATFLPEVAHQEEWNHEETIERLMRKAGAAPGTTPAARRGLNIVRYQSSARTMTYQEYCALKQGGAAAGA